jgi:prepilin peptidase CpaA
MFNATFTDLLLVALAATLVAAAVIDIRTFTISNRLNATVALGAPLYWTSIALAPWPGIAVKLGAALALWFSPAATVKFLVLMSLAGGVLTLGLLAWHRATRRGGRPQVPYGVAIAIGGLSILAPILAQRFLNQFA